MSLTPNQREQLKQEFISIIRSYLEKSSEITLVEIEKQSQLLDDKDFLENYSDNYEDEIFIINELRKNFRIVLINNDYVISKN